jgi:hypothetical protein
VNLDFILAFPNIMFKVALIVGPIDQTMVVSNNFRRSGKSVAANERSYANQQPETKKKK